MEALHPLQVERPDLEYSTERVALAPAGGEVDMANRATRAAAGRRRRMGFRARG
uniref:Phosphoesterase n=1 Tax=Arundo donax TaxID=35708 RepID=A0A0A9GB08_ARUDO